ncbi:MAG: PLP-dependent lyase/thiolase, partial [Pseudomonadota bacterium]
SFTTGHTGFSIPFTSWPDRADVPRNAARPLRYMDRFVTVTQGEVFYITQVLAELEGLQRGAAGNTSLAAAFVIAQDLNEDQVIVVQETEYTGAGKHPFAQLNLAKQLGIEIRRGSPADEKPGENIVIPVHPTDLEVVNVDLDHIRSSYIHHALASLPDGAKLHDIDYTFLAEETRTSPGYVKKQINSYQSEEKCHGTPGKK